MEVVDRYIPLNGEIIDRKYRVLKTLGEGTYGIVLKVEDVHSGNVYALKLLKLWAFASSDERNMIKTRFEGEFKCGKIMSKNVVRSIAYGQVFGNPFIVLDYMPNGDLRSVIGSLSNQHIIKYNIDILNGLYDLHKEGIIHRDLKPENVMLDHNRSARLTDFGIAGFLKARITVPRFGKVRETFGTWAYIAPEQLVDSRKFKNTGPFTDIFSFGVVAFELFSGGNYPFGNIESESDLANYIRRARNGEFFNIHTFNREVPIVWKKTIELSLSPSVANRPQDVRHLKKMIGSALPQEESYPYDFKINTLALKIVQGEEHGKVYRLNNLCPGKNGIITIGCTYNGDQPGKNLLAIFENSTNYISNFHATIEKDTVNNGWFIRDGQYRNKNGRWDWYPSTNGVYVNASKISTKGTMIRPGDIITLGDTTLKVIVYDS